MALRSPDIFRIRISGYDIDTDVLRIDLRVLLPATVYGPLTHAVTHRFKPFSLKFTIISLYTKLTDRWSNTLVVFLHQRPRSKRRSRKLIVSWAVFVDRPYSASLLNSATNPIKWLIYFMFRVFTTIDRTVSIILSP